MLLKNFGFEYKKKSRTYDRKDRKYSSRAFSAVEYVKE